MEAVLVMLVLFYLLVVEATLSRARRVSQAVLIEGRLRRDEAALGGATLLLLASVGFSLLGLPTTGGLCSAGKPHGSTFPSC